MIYLLNFINTLLILSHFIISVSKRKQPLKWFLFFLYNFYEDTVGKEYLFAECLPEEINNIGYLPRQIIKPYSTDIHSKY